MKIPHRILPFALSAALLSSCASAPESDRATLTGRKARERSQAQLTSALLTGLGVAAGVACLSQGSRAGEPDKSSWNLGAGLSFAAGFSSLLLWPWEKAKEEKKVWGPSDGAGAEGLRQPKPADPGRTLSTGEREAEGFIHKGDFAGAARLLESEWASGNESGWLLERLGTCYFQMGDKAKALDQYKRALKRDPGNAKLKSMVKGLESEGQ